MSDMNLRTWVSFPDIFRQQKNLCSEVCPLDGSMTMVKNMLSCFGVEKGSFYTAQRLELGWFYGYEYAVKIF